MAIDTLVALLKKLAPKEVTVILKYDFRYMYKNIWE